MANYLEVYRADGSVAKELFMKGPSPEVLNRGGIYYPGKEVAGLFNDKWFWKKGVNGAARNLLRILCYMEGNGYTEWLISWSKNLSDGEMDTLGSLMKSHVIKGSFAAFYLKFARMDPNIKVYCITSIAKVWESRPVWLGWCNFGVSVESGKCDLTVGSVLDSNENKFISYTYVLGTELKDYPESGNEDSYAAFQKLVKKITKISRVPESVSYVNSSSVQKNSIVVVY